MICKKCGAQIEDTASECKFCGTVYDIADAIEEKPEKVVPPVEEVPGVDTGSDAETETLFDENEIKRQRQMEKMKAEKQSRLEEIEKRRKDKKLKQRRTKIIVILVAILCIGAAAYGGYTIFNNEAGDTPNEPEVIIVTEPTATPVATDSPIETATPEVSPMPTEGPEVTEAPVVTNAPVRVPANEGAQGGQNNNGGSSGNSGTTTRPAATPKPTAVPKPVVTQKPAATSKPTTSKPSTNVKPSTSTATMGGTEYKADGGMTADGKFVSALVTGVEVVKANDKTYMSFKYNGAVYYAKVSDNTTTNFIAGKAMTLSAYKISETYNGVNVYEITAITHYNGTYVFPNSGFKLLTEADLAGKSDWELRVGRNEIYARHGRKFKDSSLQSYFNGCSWYRVKSSFDYSNDSNNLNAIERKNAAFIKKYEETH